MKMKSKEENQDNKIIAFFLSLYELNRKIKIRELLLIFLNTVVWTFGGEFIRLLNLAETWYNIRLISSIIISVIVIAVFFVSDLIYEKMAPKNLLLLATTTLNALNSIENEKLTNAEDKQKSITSAERYVIKEEYIKHLPETNIKTLEYKQTRICIELKKMLRAVFFKEETDKGKRLVDVWLHKRTATEIYPQVIYPVLNTNVIPKDGYLIECFDRSTDLFFIKSKNQAIKDKQYCPNKYDKQFKRRGKYTGTIICVNFDLVQPDKSINTQYALVLASYDKNLVEENDIHKYNSKRAIPTIFEFIDMFVDRLKIIMVLEDDIMQEDNVTQEDDIILEDDLVLEGFFH